MAFAPEVVQGLVREALEGVPQVEVPEVQDALLGLAGQYDDSRAVQIMRDASLSVGSRLQKLTGLPSTEAGREAVDDDPKCVAAIGAVLIGMSLDHAPPERRLGGILMLYRVARDRETAFDRARGGQV